MNGRSLGNAIRLWAGSHPAQDREVVAEYFGVPVHEVDAAIAEGEAAREQADHTGQGGKAKKGRPAWR